MARPVWSGTISFGLVAIPVKLFHAVRRQSVSFNQLDERNMARIRYRKVNAETGEEVGDDHIVKGYEISKGRYVVVDPDELEPFMPVGHQVDRPRGVRRPRRHRPRVLRHRVPPRPRRPAQAVRAARPGDGGQWQGGDRPVRDAQQAVHRGDPRRGGSARDVDARVRRRGDRSGRHRRTAGSRCRRGQRQGGADGRGARRVAGGRLRAREVPRRVPRGSHGADPDEGRRRGVRGARSWPREKPKVVDIMAALEASVAAAKEARTQTSCRRSRQPRRSRPDGRVADRRWQHRSRSTSTAAPFD